MDILKNMNHELKSLFHQMTPMGDASFDLVKIRSVYHARQKKIAARREQNLNVKISEEYIPGIQGHPDIRIKIYSPANKGSSKLPAILVIHGGGFYLGNADFTDNTCEDLVLSIGCVVISVDYRLAPESPYPAALYDCYGAYSWMHRETEKLGINANNIALYGVSAGGCLAAGITLMARDQGLMQPALQLLIYPVTDHRLTTSSSRAVTDKRVWSRDMAIKSWAAYLGDIDKDIPDYVSPATANDLTGLAPAYILACELDLLRDEAIEYAQRLSDSGVPTELHVYSGTFHAFDSMFPDTKISARFKSEILCAIKAALIE